MAHHAFAVVTIANVLNKSNNLFKAKKQLSDMNFTEDGVTGYWIGSLYDDENVYPDGLTELSKQIPGSYLDVIMLNDYGDVTQVRLTDGERKVIFGKWA